MGELTHTDIDAIIARQLAHEASEEEIAILLQWIQESEANRRMYFEYKDIWCAMNPTFTADAIDMQASERKILSRIKPSRKRIASLLPIIAAACLIPVVATTIWVRVFSDPAPQPAVPLYTISTAYGYTMEVVLPDSTKVWLNANSRLVYPAVFDPDERRVELQGEAYFSVAADRTHPFSVHARDMDVVATGTEFNVNAYQGCEEEAVTLVNGVVDVKFGTGSYAMRPGQRLTAIAGKTELCDVANLAKYCSWRDGILIFDDDRLSDICSRLQQIYNVEFSIEKEIAATNFHIILKGENIREIMHMLELSAPIAHHTESLSDSVAGNNLRQHIYISRRG